MADLGDATVIPLRGAAGAPLADREDEALMTLAAAGRRDAFEVLAGRYLPRLTRYCAKFVGSPFAGEEIAQETLVATWWQRARYRSTGRFPVFLFKLARNRCLNRLRDERRRPGRIADAAGELAALADRSSPDQLDLLLEQERCHRVWMALLALPEKLRESVLLRFDQALDYADIARIVGRPEATVRSRVHLALKRVRGELAGRSGS